MSKAVLIMTGEPNENTQVRQQAKHWIDRAPKGTRISFQGPQRSLDQNAKLHAVLTDISKQVDYFGQKRTVNTWKYLLMDALSRELEILPNLDNTGFVSIGRSTSDLSVSQMSDLIELAHKYGAEHGVVFKDIPPPAEPQR